jgi:hypothetical protein
MLITDMFGRVNFGATKEQALKARSRASGDNRARGGNRARRNKVPVSRGNMLEMIPIFSPRALIIIAVIGLTALTAVPCGSSFADPSGAPDTSGAPVVAPAVACLASGDGYLRAKVAGAVEANIDWPNSGTRCQGESRDKPPGVRLSFQRASAAAPDLLLVFGLTGVREGESAREVRTNLTLIVQGTNRIFGTLGDSRCTVDSLSQRPLDKPHTFRVEARGFCTQPAHAVRGKGDVLVSTFEFAGPVTYDDQKN